MIMIQETWTVGITWDEEVTSDLKENFIEMSHELSILEEIEIPRYIQITSNNLKNCTLHTFCDSIKHAAIVFLRIEKTDQVKLFHLAAKSRISLLKCETILRMELLTALIGSRLCKSVIDALD